jgi:hypothetical protein
MTTTITVPNTHGTDDRLRIDVDPFDGITVTSSSPGRSTWIQRCDSIADALGIIADEVVRICQERLVR